MATQAASPEAPPAPARRRPHWFLVGVAVAALLGLGLRVLASRPGFLGDELFTYAIVERDSLGGVIDGVRDTENTPPLFYLLSWLTLKVTGVPELIRLPSIVAGTATIAVVGLLGRRLFGAPAGLAAAALFAVSPFAVFYGSEGRSYAPAALAVVLSTLLLLDALESRRRAVWVAFAVTAAAAVWLHYTAVFPLAAQFGWALLARPDSRREVLAAHAGAVLLYVPWLPFAGAYVPVALIGALSPFSLEQVAEFPVRVIVGHPIGELDRAPGTVAAVALGALLAALLVVSARRWSPRHLRLQDPRAVVAATALAAPSGVLAYSAIKSNIFLPRNLIVSAPAASSWPARFSADRSARRSPRPPRSRSPWPRCCRPLCRRPPVTLPGRPTTRWRASWTSVPGQAIPSSKDPCSRSRSRSTRRCGNPSWTS